MPLLVTGCVSTSVFAPKNNCSALLPSEWENGVSNADLAASNDDPTEMLKVWTKFAVGQTGNLQKANERYVAAVGIVSRCEERDKTAIEKSKPKFLGIF